MKKDEVKLLLKALYEAARRCKSVEEVLEILRDMIAA